MGNNRKKNLDNTKRVTYEKQQKKKILTWNEEYTQPNFKWGFQAIIAYFKMNLFNVSHHPISTHKKIMFSLTYPFFSICHTDSTFIANTISPVTHQNKYLLNVVLFVRQTQLLLQTLFSQLHIKLNIY